MINAVFIAVLAALMAALLLWGCRTLPEERWQMIAAVPVAKDREGEWRGMNLTFYGFFSATGSVFGIGMAILLLASVQVSMVVAIILVAGMVVLCLPASRLVAAIVEKKSNTYTIAGAAFVAAILLPPVVWFGGKALGSWGFTLYAIPVLASAAIAYALAEAIGRLACMSFGCCYGMPLREASPALARTFRRFNTVFHGDTKKVAYASGLQEEPLIPVQALTSVVFTLSGLVGLGFFLGQYWRLALLVPMVGTWGWRAIAENLRADHRGHTRISVYQVMSLVAMAYMATTAFLLPANGPAPDIASRVIADGDAARVSGAADDVGVALPVLRTQPGHRFGGVIPRRDGAHLTAQAYFTSAAIIASASISTSISGATIEVT